MRASEFLIEYRQQIVKQFGPKLIQTFRELNPESDLSDRQVLETITRRIEGIDPTPNNVYMLWIAGEFIRTKKWSLLSNFTSIKQLLKVYHEYKKHPYFIKKFGENFRNIMNLTVDDLLNVKQELLALPTEIAHAKIKLKPAYEDEQVKVYIPTTQAESCKYGANTKWCTSAEKDNKFDDYNDDGPLYIVIPQQPEYPSEKYQIHLSSGEFTNDYNKPVSPTKILKRFSKFSEWFASLPHAEFIPLYWNQQQINDRYAGLKEKYPTILNYYFKSARRQDLNKVKIYLEMIQAYLDSFVTLEQFAIAASRSLNEEELSERIAYVIKGNFNKTEISAKVNFDSNDYSHFHNQVFDGIMQGISEELETRS